MRTRARAHTHTHTNKHTHTAGALLAWGLFPSALRKIEFYFGTFIFGNGTIDMGHWKDVWPDAGPGWQPFTARVRCCNVAWCVATVAWCVVLCFVCWVLSCLVLCCVVTVCCVVMVGGFG